jgi:DNA-binding NtrC family response regulator
VGESQAGYGAGPRAPATEDALCASILDRTGLELEAFAAASASRSATSRESFKAAKSQVIERFERAYITAALGRHSGNIAMAARSAQKHRRAFWALMRKHQIDAAPYRAEAQAGSWR